MKSKSRDKIRHVSLGIKMRQFAKEPIGNIKLTLKGEHWWLFGLFKYLNLTTLTSSPYSKRDQPLHNSKVVNLRLNLVNFK